jgi:hypothetical protein
LAKRAGGKDDHLIMNREIDIVRIIDWQMARTAPANEPSSRPSQQLM